MQICSMPGGIFRCGARLEGGAKGSIITRMPISSVSAPTKGTLRVKSS